MEMNLVVNQVALLFVAFSKKYPDCFCAVDRGKDYATISLFLNDSEIENIDVEQYIDSLRVGESRVWINDDPESHLRVLHVEWEASED